MRIIQCEQGSAEWFRARAGIPTASSFDKIITTTGTRSKQREKYMFQLAGERIIGKPEETYTNAAMQRGKEMEAEARQNYEFIYGETVEQVGLCVTEGEMVVGASPDGLLNANGGLEIKCPELATHVSYLLDNKLPTAYFQQVQGNLFVTGREWWDFVSYYPGLKPLLIRVERDENFIKALRVELGIFCAELEEVYKKIRQGE